MGFSAKERLLCAEKKTYDDLVIIEKNPLEDSLSDFQNLPTTQLSLVQSAAANRRFMQFAAQIAEHGTLFLNPTLIDYMTYRFMQLNHSSQRVGITFALLT